MFVIIPYINQNMENNMKQWFEKISRKMNTWMIGRYGTDEFSRFLLWTGVILMIISWFIKNGTGVSVVYALAWVCVIYSYFRTFSKNIIKRSKERETFLRMTAKSRSNINIWKKRWHDRSTHNYYRCPKCHTMIRVPKGKGKIVISCPKCRNEIVKTT